MEAFAELKYARVSAQKARLVVDQIRGMGVAKAKDLLAFSQKKSGNIILKVLKSAIHNAEQNFNMDVDALYISKAVVNQGPALKRMSARAKGRGNRILKRMSHITICVAE